MMLIVATVAAPFYWFQLSKFLLPIAKHMRFYTTQIADLANGKVALCGNRRQHNRHRFARTFTHGLSQTARTSGLRMATSTMPFSFWLAWKVTTRRAVMGISS